MWRRWRLFVSIFAVKLRGLVSCQPLRRGKKSCYDCFSIDTTQQPFSVHAYLTVGRSFWAPEDPGTDGSMAGCLSRPWGAFTTCHRFQKIELFKKCPIPNVYSQSAKGAFNSFHIRFSIIWQHFTVTIPSKIASWAAALVDCRNHYLHSCCLFPATASPSWQRTVQKKWKKKQRSSQFGHLVNFNNWNVETIERWKDSW